MTVGMRDLDWSVEIHIKGHLPTDWSDWLDGLTIENLEHGEAVVSGQLPDQSALIGLLNRLHALNLIIICYRWLPQNS